LHGEIQQNLLRYSLARRRICERPNDSGGATNKIIAWQTWLAYAKEDLNLEPTLENLRALTDDQARLIYFKRYWEPKGFRNIHDERVALMIYDWTITSGHAVKKIQEVLAVSFAHNRQQDNKLSKAMVNSLNSIPDQNDLVQKIAEARRRHYSSLAYKSDDTPSKNIVFLNGWLRRVNDCLGYK
jgi:lysozyme family protein